MLERAISDRAYHVLVKIDQSSPVEEKITNRHFFVRADSEGNAIAAVKACWHCTDEAMPELQFTVKRAQRSLPLAMPDKTPAPDNTEVYSL
jgi:hypothetical protein